MNKASFLGLVGIFVLSLCMQTPSAGADEAIVFDFSSDPLAQFRQPPSLRLTCPTVETPPNVDGKLDDAAWGGAAVIERLARDTPRTTVRVRADERALYVGVLCQHHDGQPPQAQKFDRDGALWRDDCIEIWIAPDLNRVVNYQFVVNSANSIYDAMNYGGRGQASHNPRWDHEAFLSARGPEQQLEADTRIAVDIDLPDGIDAVGSWPVTFGVPFAAGALWDAAGLRVVDGKGSLSQK